MKKKFLNASMKAISNSRNYSQDELDIIHYGLETIYLTITKVIVIFSLAFILGIFKGMFLLLITYNVIRSQAFGIHASKSIYCLISSIIMFIGGAFICKYAILPFYITVIIAFICNICLFLYAPADTYKRPLINAKKRKRFKFLSCLFGIIYTVIIILFKDSFITNYLVFGMIAAVLMILPVSYKLFKLPYANYKNYDYGV